MSKQNQYQKNKKTKTKTIKLKRDSNTSIFPEILQKFLKQLFYRIPLVAASAHLYLQMSSRLVANIGHRSLEVVCGRSGEPDDQVDSIMMDLYWQTEKTNICNITRTSQFG